MNCNAETVHIFASIMVLTDKKYINYIAVIVCDHECKGKLQIQKLAKVLFNFKQRKRPLLQKNI